MVFTARRRNDEKTRLGIKGRGRGCGTIFKLTPGGSGMVLYAFQGGNTGCSPAVGCGVVFALKE